MAEGGDLVGGVEGVRVRRPPGPPGACVLNMLYTREGQPLLLLLLPPVLLLLAPGPALLLLDCAEVSQHLQGLPSSSTLFSSTQQKGKFAKVLAAEPLRFPHQYSSGISRTLVLAPRTSLLQGTWGSGRGH